MRLSELLEVRNIAAGDDSIVTGLTADSRQVKPGYIFAALKGTASDGREFVDSAIQHGAVAILVDLDFGREDYSVYCLKTDNPRQKLAYIAARFYGAMPGCIAAVTGTNGKTSVAHFTRLIWQNLGLASASLGTFGVVTKDGVEPLHYTSPEPVLLHEKLHSLETSGITHLALEASSHGLDQHRLDAVKVTVAAFTNITRDHLDYHEDIDAYLEAKLGLVSRVLQEHGTVVLNADSDAYSAFRDAADDRNLKVLSYGYAGQDLHLKSLKSHPAGQDVNVCILGDEYTLDLPLAGEFQILNILCAMGMVIAAGYPVETTVEAVSHIENVPGRLEQIVTLSSGASVYVDFAHTPDALETVLKSLKPHAEGKIHAVIGCGGDRDKGKRPEMGKIAAALADVVYVTDDNPRTENPKVIRAEIMAACPRAREIGDRKLAIETAMSAAGEGDLVLIAGKGHESGQIIGDRIIPFNDKEVVLEITALQEEGV